MAAIYSNIATFSTGILIAILLLRSCGETPRPEIQTVVKYDTVTEVVYYPELSGEGKSTLKYTYSGKIRDTIVRNDSVFIDVKDSLSFTAILDTVQQSDTLHLEFNYPSAMFKYRLNRQPDSVLVVNSTETITHYVEPTWYEKPSFTIPATAGVLVSILLLVR